MKRNKTAPTQTRLGLDIGYVILAGTPTDLLLGTDGKKRNNFLAVRAVHGAMRGTRQLVERWFQADVWLVSRCSEKTAAKVRAWLEYHQFFRKTGIHREYLRFCLQDEEKTKIAQALRLTHFVDDRLVVLTTMYGKIPHLFLFRPTLEEQARYKALPEGQRTTITVVHSWRELVNAIALTITTGNQRGDHRVPRKRLRHPSV